MRPRYRRPGPCRPRPGQPLDALTAYGNQLATAKISRAAETSASSTPARPGGASFADRSTWDCRACRRGRTSATRPPMPRSWRKALPRAHPMSPAKSDIRSARPGFACGTGRPLHRDASHDDGVVLARVDALAPRRRARSQSCGELPRQGESVVRADILQQVRALLLELQGARSGAELLQAAQHVGGGLLAPRGGEAPHRRRAPFVARRRGRRLLPQRARRDGARGAAGTAREPRSGREERELRELPSSRGRGWPPASAARATCRSVPTIDATGGRPAAAQPEHVDEPLPASSCRPAPQAGRATASRGSGHAWPSARSLPRRIAGASASARAGATSGRGAGGPLPLVVEGPDRLYGLARHHLLDQRLSIARATSTSMDASGSTRAASRAIRTDEPPLCRRPDLRAHGQECAGQPAAVADRWAVPPSRARCRCRSSGAGSAARLAPSTWSDSFNGRGAEATASGSPSWWTEIRWSAAPSLATRRSSKLSISRRRWVSAARSILSSIRGRLRTSISTPRCSEATISQAAAQTPA